MTAIECRGVCHAYGETVVLDGLDLDVPEGAVTAVIGRSGSGKSTLLRLIAGFERTQAGQIIADGAVIAGPGKHLATHRRRVGYVPQDAALFPHLTVGANVGFGVRTRVRRRQRIQELLELVGLAGLDKRYPHELSGGQQQRVALARALAIEPRLVLLDEPFAALDANLRIALRRDVLRILRETNTTTVLVTHDQAEALSSADHLGFLESGRVRQFGSPEQLYTAPTDRDVAGFLGEANFLRGTASARGVECALGTLQSVAADLRGDVTVVVRPEQIAMTPNSGGSGWRVSDVEYFGHDSLYTLTDQGRTGQQLQVRGHANLAAVGSTVDLTVEGQVTAWADESGQEGPAREPA